MKSFIGNSPLRHKHFKIKKSFTIKAIQKQSWPVGYTDIILFVFHLLLNFKIKLSKYKKFKKNITLQNKNINTPTNTFTIQNYVNPNHGWKYVGPRSILTGSKIKKIFFFFVLLAFLFLFSFENKHLKKTTLILLIWLKVLS